MRIRYSKKISSNLLEDTIDIIIDNLKKHGKVKITNFGTFTMRKKNEREGRNPKTKEKKIITKRRVVLFKPSKIFKDYINSNEEI